MDVRSFQPENGVASEGKAWLKTEETPDRLVYERDCSYDTGRAEDREEKEMRVHKDGDEIRMNVYVVFDGSEYEYTRIVYDASESVIRINHGSEGDRILEDVTEDKVESLFADLLWDESRHGARNFELY